MYEKVYNVKVRFDKDNKKIAGDISDVMDYDSCIKNMHQYFVNHMDEENCYKIAVSIHDASDDRCMEINTETWCRSIETEQQSETE